MTNERVIDQTQTYIRETFWGEASGHDWWHIYRVWQTALHLAQNYPVDMTVVQLASLLHDIADWKFHDGNLTVGAERARHWLESLHVDSAVIEHVAEIIATLSFKGAGVPTPMRTLEGKIVQDADRLDAIGAIGVARTFAYGGYKGHPMYDPTLPPQGHATFEAYKNAPNTTINHFYEKLLLLKDLLNTPEAQTIALKRHQFMEAFLAQFFEEWHTAFKDGGAVSVVNQNGVTLNT